MDLEGQLSTRSLDDMMIPLGIKDFYLILPEISVDDWNSYYKSEWPYLHVLPADQAFMNRPM